jgi:hypothetical protein
MIIDYKISIPSMHSMEYVVTSLNNINSISAEVEYKSPVEPVLKITVPDDITNSDILILGSLIGSLQTEALYN